MFEAVSLVLAGVGNYLGFSCLALSLPTHWKAVGGAAPMPRRRSTILRAAGYPLLVVGSGLAVLRDGPAFGSVLALLLLSVSAWAVAFTLAWRPHWLRPLTVRPAPAAPVALPPIASLFTAIVWLGCLTVGGVGFALPRPRPQPRPPEPPPLVAELVEVQLEPAPQAPPEPPPDPSPPPPLADLALPPAAPLVAVAAPSAQIAFAVPVPGPVRIVDARLAGYVRPTEPAARAAGAAPPVQIISYGQGEGKQPAPDYPSQAMREGQEGPVVVRFGVAQDGRVLAAELARPSPWPLLNSAALRVVRERWSFRPGRVRLYEVSIRFELTK